MADPTKFTPSYDFSDYQASSPSTPLPGAQVDIQLQEIKAAVDSTVDAIKSVRRSDGALKNGIVTADSLASSLVIGFTLRGAWAADLDYMAGDGVIYDEIFYKSRVAHTSAADTRPDLDTDTWEYLTSLASISITDNSVTPAKLISGQEDGFLAKIGVWAKLGALIAGGTGKTTPADADTLALSDSGAADASKKLTWANLKATLVSALFAKLNAAQTWTAAQTWSEGAAIASAATLTLGTDGNFFHVTGTTTITAISGAASPVTLVFDGALTLTHNATSLILPGAANILTAAGDTAIMVSEGAGNWRCLSYQRLANGPLLTEAKAASTTEVAFTGVPPWVRRITLVATGISMDETADYLIQLGDSGGYEATGYTGGVMSVSGAGVDTFSTSFKLSRGFTETLVTNFTITLTLTESATNTWGFSCSLGTTTGVTCIANGSKSLSATLDRLRIINDKSAPSANFDGGHCRVFYLS